MLKPAIAVSVFLILFGLTGFVANCILSAWRAQEADRNAWHKLGGQADDMTVEFAQVK